jgi:uncharacterized membrane protein YccF (DUF307 family)
MLKTLGNILWHFPFFGFLNAIAVYLVGLLLTATVIAAPIGLGLMEFGKFLFAPFGRAMVSKNELATEQNKAWKAYSTVVMILYLPFGLILSIAAAVQVGLLFITIVGIPVALVIAKSLGTYWNPVNKKCVHLAVAEELERRKGEAAIHRHLNSTGAGGVMDATPEAVMPQPTAERSTFPPAAQSAVRELKGAASKMAGQLAALRMPTGSAVKSCASCGASVSNNASFCGQCGAPVQRLKCPQCSEVNAPTARFCVKCGGELGSTETPSTRPESRHDGDRSAAATSTPATTATAETASKPKEFVSDENVRALPLRQPSPFMRSERVEQLAPSDAERIASPAGPIVRPVSDEPRSAEPAHTSSDDGTSRRWLAIGALVVLAAAGGGYWLYKSRDASPQVVEETQAPDSQTPETYAPRAQEGDVVEPPASATSETPSSAQPQVADAPQVSVGDRWVTEVVDHQDAALSYRAERTVTDVGPDRIFTSVRTLGKDYTRVVEYTGEWALVATHLRSGATTSYSPALPYLSFPLQTGRSWQERVVETDAEGKQRVHNVRAQMESWETVQVPAGTFESLKIVLSDDISKDGVVVQQGQDVSWYAPEARRTVKTEETSFDPATGERRRRTISLVEYSVGGGDGSVSGSEYRSPAMTESSMDLTPLFAGIENSCSPPDEFQALLHSLGYTEQQTSGLPIWKRGTPVVPERYRPAFGALAMIDKSGYTEFTVPVSGMFYGLPITLLMNGRGNENGIFFYAIRIEAPVGEVERVLSGKLNRTQRLLYETEGPPIEARIVAEDGASLLECNFSD